MCANNSLHNNIAIMMTHQLISCESAHINNELQSKYACNNTFEAKN